MIRLAKRNLKQRLFGTWFCDFAKIQECYELHDKVETAIRGKFGGHMTKLQYFIHFPTILTDFETIVLYVILQPVIE